ncbi:MAG: alkaline phosphatase [Saprospiraceae bacterium]|nr:alkaline phosphatase [Saprospiraceae bacterium]
MKNIALLSLLLLLLGCNPQTGKGPTGLDEIPTYSALPNMPKNVILMIGDGMGLTQITAGMIKNDNKLNLERCQFTGLHKSYSYDNLITDSAAGATAFACGIKTYNQAIGVGPDTLPRKTILELLTRAGYKTGLVATSTIVHATPASFYAHVANRKQYEDIATALSTCNVDYFVGGGLKYFNRRENDERDLVKEMMDNGYQMSNYFEADFDSVEPDPTKKFGYLTADNDPLMASQGRNYLQPATEEALQFLKAKSADDGFFLMVEGSQIDWGGHGNDANYIVTEMIDFDNTIGKVLDFAQADGETLVVITADHETGGFAINPGSTKEEIIAAFTTKNHTGTMIPVFAYGPGASLFSGIYENTEIYYKIRHALGMPVMEPGR